MKKKVKRFVVVIAFFAVLVMINSAEASFLVKIKESSLNKLANNIGSISGSGHHRVRVSYPCFDFWDWEWKTCKLTLFEADYSWIIHNVTFHISPSGMTYTGSLIGSYGGIPCSATVTGSAALSVINNSLVFSLSSVSIPLDFDVPVIGKVRVTTINRSLPYSSRVPFDGFAIVTNPPAGQRSHVGIITDLSLQYIDGGVNISGDVIFW